MLVGFITLGIVLGTIAGTVAVFSGYSFLIALVAYSMTGAVMIITAIFTGYMLSKLHNRKMKPQGVLQ